MLISDLCTKLEDIIQMSGDLEVYRGDFSIVLGCMSPLTNANIKVVEVARLFSKEQQARYNVNDEPGHRTGKMVLYVGR
jgi:hypothetical protein